MPESLSIGTFNLENLFLRYKFFYSLPKKKHETSEEQTKREKKEQAQLERLRKEGGYIQNLKTILEDKKQIKAGQTRNTAKVILAHKPDIIAVQEVEDLEALRKFNSQYLNGYYPYRLLIDGNDPRMIDVGVLSKYPFSLIRSNMHVPDPATGKPFFSRDCLEVRIGMADQENGSFLTLFINHFKSQLGKTPQEREDAKKKRGRQAQWVAKMLTRRYGADLSDGDFVVLGDFNNKSEAEELQPLLQLSGLENIVQTRPLEVPGQPTVTDGDRWTHYFDGDKSTSQLDYILLSPTIAKKSTQEKVIIEKRGLADYVKVYKGPRFPGVGPSGTEASDHCAVFTSIRL